MISSRRLIWTAALLVFAACRVLPPAAGLDRAGQTVLGIAAAMALLWALDAAPLGVTSLLALVLLGTVPGLRPTQVFGGFAFPVVFFLIGGVAIAIAVERTGLATRVARQLLAGARGRPGRLYAQLLVSLPAMAVFLPSAITRNAILIPAYRESLDAMGLRPTDGRARAVMLTLGVLNPLASSALLTGGIASMTAASLLGGFSWLRWFVLMAVPYYALLTLGAIALWLTSRAAGLEHRPVAERAVHTPLTGPERRTLVVLLLTTTLWLTDAWHGLNPSIPALLAALLLVAPGIGVFGWKDLEARLSWELILTVGASLSLASALTSTTAAPWLGSLLTAGTVTELQTSPLALVGALIVIVTVVHLGITNLAACLALLLPIVTTTTAAAGLNPLAIGLIVTVVVDAVILYPVQTATNLIAYQTGYFTTADVRRFGFVMLGLTLVVILGVAIPYWKLIGLPLVATR